MRSRCRAGCNVSLVETTRLRASFGKYGVAEVVLRGEADGLLRSTHGLVARWTFESVRLVHHRDGGEPMAIRPSRRQRNGLHGGVNRVTMPAQAKQRPTSERVHVSTPRLHRECFLDCGKRGFVATRVEKRLRAFQVAAKVDRGHRRLPFWLRRYVANSS